MTKRLLRLGSVLAMIGALVVPSAARAASATFERHVVQPGLATGEPGLTVDPGTNPATIYVTAPLGTTQVWRSTDGAAFTRAAPTRGSSGDADVAVDADGTLYAADLLGGGGTMFASTSFDQGRTWDYGRALDAGGDREWVAAEGHGHVVFTGRVAGCNAWVSRDAGAHWSSRVDVDASGTLCGPVMIAPDGGVYQATESGSSVRIARSDDGGDTWHIAGIAGSSGDALTFPAVVADDAGTLYATWSTRVNPPPSAGIYGIALAVSHDRGETWSDPTILSPRDTQSIFAWPVAGAPGRVAVAWYHSSDTLDPNAGTATTRWDVYLAQSLDADSESPTWTTSEAVHGFHVGSVCTEGIACAGPQQLGFGNAPTPFDRRVLDYFETAIDPAGHIMFVYPQDRAVVPTDPMSIVSSASDLTLAVQVSGPTLR